MPLTPLTRASVTDILAGYTGRRVYSENDLRIALADTSVKAIVIAGNFGIGGTVAVTRPVIIAATGTLRSTRSPPWMRCSM